VLVLDSSATNAKRSRRGRADEHDNDNERETDKGEEGCPLLRHAGPQGRHRLNKMFELERFPQECPKLLLQFRIVLDD
jgi:hypothetical protein